MAISTKNLHNNSNLIRQGHSNRFDRRSGHDRRLEEKSNQYQPTFDFVMPSKTRLLEERRHVAERRSDWIRVSRWASIFPNIRA